MKKNVSAMRYKLFPFLILVFWFSSCKVDFSPNAQWKDVPSVYCVLDIDEDTVWARVQKCYLGEDNLYGYAGIADSTNYPQGTVRVVLNAYKGLVGANNALTATDQLVDSWELTYTMRNNIPEGSFSSEPQPIYYCVPAGRLAQDSDCVFQLLVIRNRDNDTLARATTSLVKRNSYLRDEETRQYVEQVLMEPNTGRGHHYGFIPTSRNVLKWLTIPRGRVYQPMIKFYYRKGGDTLSIDIPGEAVKDERATSTLSSSSISQNVFLSTIKTALSGNTDSLFNVNHVDVYIFVGNEDLNAYMTSQSSNVTSGQEFSYYSNIEGGVGIFASRRTHLYSRVPCDSTGKKLYLPDKLKELGVGFYGQFE